MKETQQSVCFTCRQLFTTLFPTFTEKFVFSYVANESLCSRQCDVIIIYSFQKVATAVILINYGEFFCSIIVFIKKHVYAFANIFIH